MLPVGQGWGPVYGHGNSRSAAAGCATAAAALHRLGPRHRHKAHGVRPADREGTAVKDLGARKKVSFYCLPNTSRSGTLHSV